MAGNLKPGFWQRGQALAAVQHVRGCSRATKRSEATRLAAKLGVPAQKLLWAAAARPGRRVTDAQRRVADAQANHAGPAVTIAPMGRGEFLLTVHDGRKTLLFRGYPVQLARSPS